MKMHLRLFMVIMVMASSSWAQPDADAELRQEARRQTESIQSGGRHWPVLITEFFEIHHLPTTIPDLVAVPMWPTLSAPCSVKWCAGKPAMAE